MFDILTRRIYKHIENTGERPQRIALTQEQLNSLIDGIPFYREADTEPDQVKVTRFMGVEVEIVEVIEPAGAGRRRK